MLEAGQIGPKSIQAYLSLGSNLGPRGEMLQRAVSLLAQRPGLRVAALSSVYQTKPWGIFDCAAQQPFWNLCVRLELDEALCPAHELLRYCLRCEAQLGRTPRRGRTQRLGRTPRRGRKRGSSSQVLQKPQELPVSQARCIDLDLIDYKGVRLQGADLTLPHPRFLERLFVLVPLLEVAGPELERAYHLRQAAERLKAQNPDWGHKIGELSAL